MYNFHGKTNDLIFVPKMAHSLNPKPKENVPLLRNHFFNTWRSIYHFPRAFGLMPFSIICGTNGEVCRAQVKLFDLFWFTFSICLNLFSSFFGLDKLTFQHGKVEEIDVLRSIIQLNDVVQFILPPTIIAISMYNRSCFIDILKELTSYDKEVRVCYSNDSIQLHSFEIKK